MYTTLCIYSILIAMGLTGAALLQENRLTKIARAKARELVQRIDQGFSQSSSEHNLLEGTGYSITPFNYTLLRCLLLIFGTLGGLAIRDERMAALFVLISILSTPRARIGSVTTPFGFILKKMQAQYGFRKDAEIYEAMAFLKNSIVLSINHPIGSDLIIEQLAGYGELLKPTYFKMLNLLRLNRREEAIDLFGREAGTRVSRDFGRLLIQLDEISPRELEETLLSYQKNIREVKATRQKLQDEMMSDLLYLPVVINVLMIFVNFIYVAYFIEQKELFGLLIS